ncbi:MAG: sel1 repeat family protein [Endozoicomonadaceae bacterium]|nr:sel1 repeat family protein [Endozoicomonadaceae bacterium]
MFKKIILVSYIILATSCASTITNREDKIKIAASDGIPAAQLDYSKLLMSKGQFAKGREYLLKAVAADHSESQKYWNTYNTWINDSLKATQGDVLMQRKLGLSLLTGANPLTPTVNTIEGLRWLKIAGMNDDYSAYQLGVIFDKGIIVDKDSEASSEWYIKASEMGHLDSRYKMFQRYQSGTGVNIDKKKGFEWLYLAAVNGHAKSIIKLTSLTNSKFVSAADRVYWSLLINQNIQGPIDFSESLAKLKKVRPINPKTELFKDFGAKNITPILDSYLSQTYDLYVLFTDGSWSEVFVPALNRIGFVRTDALMLIKEERFSNQLTRHELCLVECKGGFCEQYSADGEFINYTFDESKVHRCAIRKVW